MNGLRKYNYIKNKRVEEEVKLFMFIHNLLSLLTYAVKQWRRKYFVKFTHETDMFLWRILHILYRYETHKRMYNSESNSFPNEKNVMIYTGRRIKFIFTCKDISNVYFFFFDTFANNFNNFETTNRKFLWEERSLREQKKSLQRKYI